MNEQNQSPLDYIKNILGVAGGKEAIKVEVAVDPQSAASIGLVVFIAVLAAIIIGALVTKAIGK